MLITLARLGLRAGEVARLLLDDIDWRAEELVVHGKHSRVDRLPLPVDVGEAIVAYLRAGRPDGALDRAVFIRVRAPYRSVSDKGVTMMVRQRGHLAGLGAISAHLLRHTLASEMLLAGGSLPEIGRCCAISILRRPRSTPRSTEPRFGRSHARGRERAHEPAPRSSR